METTTARVDLQRLQILSDRIAHTLEALNQVRLSAHSAGVQTQWGYRPEIRPEFYGYNYNTVGYGVQPMTPYYNNVVAPFGYNQVAQPFGHNHVAQPFGYTAPMTAQSFGLGTAVAPQTSFFGGSQFPMTQTAAHAPAY